jgi:predicted PurR-regulated permease PerM
MTGDKQLNKIMFGLIILALGLFIFHGTAEFFPAFLGAIVFYILFKRLMIFWVKKKKMNKSLSAALIIILSFLIVVLPVGILVGILYTKIAEIVGNPEQITTTIHNFDEKLTHLPFKVSTKDMTSDIQGFAADTVSVIFTSTLNILASLVMMYFFMYFMLIKANTLEAGIIYFAPFEKNKILLFGKELVVQTKSNAIGVPLIALAQGVLGYIEFSICGLPEAGMWAILTGFASIIPIVGTAAIWAPIAVYFFLSGQVWQGIFISTYGIAVIGTVDNIVRMIVSRKIGDVHPIVTVLGVILGLKFFGLPGLVFGPLIISYFLLFLKLYYIEYDINNIREKTEVSDDNKRNMFTSLLNGILNYNYSSRRRGHNPGEPGKQ